VAHAISLSLAMTLVGGCNDLQRRGHGLPRKPRGRLSCHNMTTCDHNRNMTTTHKCASTSHNLGTDADGGREWKKKAVRVTCGRT
jgi:hypothetical protein